MGEHGKFNFRNLLLYFPPRLIFWSIRTNLVIKYLLNLCSFKRFIHHWMPEYWEVRASARNVSPEKPIEEGLHSLIKDRL